MASVIPDVGRDWYADRATQSGNSDFVNIVAVGQGTSSPSSTDTQLADELYRAQDSNENVTIERTSTTGEIRCRISVTGGLEVPANSDITEFGLFSDAGTLLYREVRSSAVTVESGETQTFEFKMTITE